LITPPLFRCNKQFNLVHGDIRSSDFEGRYIASGSKLKEINQEISP
jgi:hypothetical protein